MNVKRLIIGTLFPPALLFDRRESAPAGGELPAIAEPGRITFARRMNRLSLSRLAALSVCALVPVAAVGCGSSSSSPKPPSATTSALAPTPVAASSEHFTVSNWAVLATDPNSHKGATVNFVGKVFVAPQTDQKGVYLQVWEDPQNYQYDTIVAYPDPNFVVSDGDYVQVSGTVKGQFNGKNAFGASITATTILANNLKVVSATAAAPSAIATYGTATYTQAGVTVTIRKIELARSEMRVYATVANNSGANVNVFGTSMKAVQNGVQHDSTFSLAAYPQLATDVVPGASTSGVVVFPPLNPTGGLKLYVDVNSQDYNVGNYGTLTYIFTWR
jgi:hypothetical protein